MSGWIEFFSVDCSWLLHFKGLLNYDELRIQVVHNYSFCVALMICYGCFSYCNAGAV